MCMCVRAANQASSTTVHCKHPSILAHEQMTAGVFVSTTCCEASEWTTQEQKYTKHNHNKESTISVCVPHFSAEWRRSSHMNYVHWNVSFALIRSQHRSLIEEDEWVQMSLSLCGKVIIAFAEVDMNPELKVTSTKLECINWYNLHWWIDSNARCCAVFESHLLINSSEMMQIEWTFARISFNKLAIIWVEFGVSSVSLSSGKQERVSEIVRYGWMYVP